MKIRNKSLLSVIFEVMIIWKPNALLKACKVFNIHLRWTISIFRITYWWQHWLFQLILCKSMRRNITTKLFPELYLRNKREIVNKTTLGKFVTLNNTNKTTTKKQTNRFSERMSLIHQKRRKKKKEIEGKKSECYE